MNILLEFGADVYFPVDVHKMIYCVYMAVSVFMIKCVSISDVRW